MLSDIGSWASILGLILSFFAGFGICKITTGNFKQAIDDLNSLIDDNSNPSLKSVKYQLLLL